MTKPNHWWVPALGRWVHDDDMGTLKAVNIYNCRSFKTFKRLEKAVISTEPPFYAEATYYKTSRKGRGWLTKWVLRED
jgi:hypothetical protein